MDTVVDENCLVCVPVVWEFICLYLITFQNKTTDSHPLSPLGEVDYTPNERLYSTKNLGSGLMV